MPTAERKLLERVKELAALHACAQLLRDDNASLEALVEGVCRLLPPAFQHPERAVARVRVGEVSATTAATPETSCVLRAQAGGADDDVEIAVWYLEPAAFLAEEQALLVSFAELVAVEWRRRRATLHLEGERERLALALQVAEMGIWELDVATRRVRWSADLARFIGHSGGDLRGELFEFAQWIHEEDQERIKSIIAGAIADGGPDRIDLEFRLRRPEGGWRQVRGRGHVICDADGHATRIIATISDITQRRTLEQQLRQAQKLEAMGLVAGSVAHDFNNLLSVILTTSGMLKAELQGEHQEMAADINEAATRGSTLTKQLLAFGRKTEAPPSRVLLTNVIASGEPILTRLLKPSCTLLVEQADEPLSVWADPGQLDQLLMNLVLNARDAMSDKARGQVRISTSRVQIEPDLMWPEASAGPGAELAVTDVGTGIHPDVLPRLFEPFFTTKGPGKGTGLGLSVVFGVVKHCRGVLRIDTKLGAGTTFRVQLPLMDG